MRDPGWPAELWLIRHAESTGNVAAERARVAGAATIDVDGRDADVPLSERGREQAAALGRWLAERPADAQPTVVFRSPYQRTRETAAVALRCVEVSPQLDERLRDRDLGVFDRLTRRGIGERYPEQAALRAWLGKFYHRPPSGESWADVLLRLRSFLTTLRLEHADARVAIVTHDVVIVLFRYLLEDLDERAALALSAERPVANCGLTSYRLRGDRLELVAYNEVAPVAGEGAPVTVEQSGRHA